MAFLLYTKHENYGKEIYENTNDRFSLAGYNLIYKAWKKNGSPINIGWSITNEELSDLVEKENEHSYAFLIDFDPNADWRIGIIEIQKIHVFTYGDVKTKEVWWSPLMLELRDILYLDLNEENIDLSEKEKILKKIALPKKESSTIIEFLYLNGSSWNWGKNGMTNAAFIQKAARDYFRQFF